ncbi:MAG: hypothetical protein DHS20C14_16360 [Phycisphaeraceae bacterium]|nr:MAG: hypothetical protein DHS20C14_16360 [Phycisphaeraceae bacterium]
MTNPTDYLLGTDDVELTRLGVQHRLWAASAAKGWERARVRPGSRVLDIGSGPGYAAMDLAELVGPRGRVLGVEGSPAFTDEFNTNAAQRGFAHATAINGDVHDLRAHAADEAGTFDAAWARWVLCFVEDAAKVVREAFACLAPGGRLVVQDYFGYEESIKLAPRSPAFERGIAGISASWRATGSNLDIMGDMPAMMRAAGFGSVEVRVIQRIARPHEQMWAWPDIFWPSFIPRVVEAGFLTQLQADAFMDAWRAASENPDAFILLPPVFEAIAVKPA